MTQVVNKKNIKVNNKEDNEISTDSDVIPIRKKDIEAYGDLLISTKNAHKNRAINAEAEVLDLREKNELLTTGYSRLANAYKDLKNRTENKKVHKINDINQMIPDDLENEMKQVDTEARKKYEEIRKKNRDAFMSQFIL